MDIIPAIDLIEGRCVRLTQGNYSSSRVYDSNPVDMAKSYADCGVRRLHIVDLDGAKAKAPCNLKVLEHVANAVDMDIEWGGGIKDETSLCMAIDAGATRVICGSVAVDNREQFKEWLSRYGSTRIILGADVRNGLVSTHGWLKDSGVTIDELIKGFLPAGLSQLICTDIERDGMLQGPNYPLYVRLQKDYPEVDVTLSGGISTIKDIETAHDMGLRAVIIGKAIYEGCITLKEIEQWLLNV